MSRFSFCASWLGLCLSLAAGTTSKIPRGRSKDIEASKGFTIFLGVAELAAGLGVIFGVLAQLAAIGLILIMLGAIQRKIFVRRTGFWGKIGNKWMGL
jgi:putative oxidoreductase